MLETFATDYDLDALIQIQTKGTDLPFLVTPRFLDHYVRQEYEPFSIELLKNYLKPKSVFVDVGSHYGYYSVAAAKYANVNVMAVEPVAENYRILQKNLALNHVTVKETFNAAASDHDGMTQFNVTEASDSAGFYDHPLTQTKQVVNVKTLALDSILYRTAKKIDFIKIDVEGHEIAVLNGLKRTLHKNKSIRLLIEFNPKCQITAGHQPDELLTALSKLGFELFIVDENKRQLYRLTESEYTWADFVPKNGYVNILCLPKKTALYAVTFSHTTNLAGAERSLLELVQGLVQRGALTHVVFPALTGEFVTALAGTGITHSHPHFTWWAGITEKVPTEQLRHSVQNMLAYIPELKQMNPHVIYTNTGVIPWGAFVAELINKPHIWHLNEFIDQDHGLVPNLSIPQLSEYIEAKSDYVIANSKAVADHFQRFFKHKEILAQYYTMAVKTIKKTHSVFTGKGNSVLKLLVLGGIHPGKGQDQAIQAVNQLVAEGKRIELKIVGGYSDKSEYFQTLKRLAEPNQKISFIQKVADPANYLHQCDALIMSSKQEAFGRVTVEAMLHGKPVIAAASGGSLEIIKDGQTGKLYQPTDANDLKNKITFYYDNPLLLKKHGAAAKKRATRLFVQNRYLEDSLKLFFQSKLLAKTPTAYQQFFGEILIELGLTSQRFENAFLTQNLTTQIDSQNYSVEESHRMRSELDKIKNGKIWKVLSIYFSWRDRLKNLFTRA